MPLRAPQGVTESASPDQPLLRGVRLSKGGLLSIDSSSGRMTAATATANAGERIAVITGVAPSPAPRPSSSSSCPALPSYSEQLALASLTLLQLAESKANMDAVTRAMVGMRAWPRRRTGFRGVTLCGEKNTPIRFNTLSQESSITKAPNSSSYNICTFRLTLYTRIACFRISVLRLSSYLCLLPNGSLPI